jgi:phosphatidylinositol alpha-1,6-mannosyltransferase
MSLRRYSALSRNIDVKEDIQVKVLLITRNFPPMLGGSCVVYEELCRRISPDLEVLVAAFDPELEARWDRDQPYRIFRSPALAALPPARGPFSRIWRSTRAYLWKYPGTLIAASKAARKSRPELVCFGSQHWLAQFVRRVLHVPVIFYSHGEELTCPDTSRLAGTRSFYNALRKADGIIAVSRFTRARLLELGVSADRVELIPNGVDLSRFTPGEKDPAIMDRYGLREKRVLLTVGRLEERKGHATVLRALPRILQSCPDVIYVVVGTGTDDYLPDLGLDTLARKLGVADHVVFAGKVPPERLCGFYRTCEIFVMPNRTLPNGDTEGFGLVFLEAAACGKPVIGGRDGGVPDAVVDGETGILVNGASAEEFADATVRLLTDRDLAARLGSQGFRRAQEMSWEGAAGKFRSFCAKVIQGRTWSPGPPQPDGGTGTQTDRPAAPRNER